MQIRTERGLPVLFGFLLLAGGIATLAIATRHHLGLADESVVAPSVIQSLVEGAGALWINLATFGMAFGVVHFLCGWVVGHLGLRLGRVLGWEARARTRLAWSLLLATALWVWLHNAAEFHHSLYAWPEAVDAEVLAVLVGILGWLLALALGAGLIVPLISRLAEWPPRTRLRALGFAALAIAGTSAFVWLDTPRAISGDPKRPHVIIIGIDSWRLDTLSTHGGNPEVMPHVEALLQESQVFEEGLTSLARSYPSWWSVLSGQHPINHGARFNLIDRQQVQAPPRLTESLGELGYYRLFGMDERRFANIDTSHGFDRIVGPETGAADFLLGTIADTPLSNLAINTWPGQWLFPHIHGNRAAYVTYRPETFTRMLSSALRRIPDQPLLLTVHHELPHWPYHWAEGPTGKFRSMSDDPEFAHYLETLHHADQQVGVLLQALDEMNILQNSLLFVISDHGEAFRTDRSSYHDPRMSFGWESPNLPYELPDSPDDTGPLQSYPGHGTHILSLEQHKIPIIFRDFTSTVEPGILPGRATLADIYPTIMSRLNVPPEEGLDGISLLPFLQGGRTLPDRPIPLETGFASRLLLTGELDVAALMMENIAHYRVLDNGALVLKPEKLGEFVRCKQFGVLYDDRVHAVIGQNRRLAVKMDLARSRIERLPREALGRGMGTDTSIRPAELLGSAILSPPCRS